MLDSLRCPVCRTSLGLHGETLECSGCPRAFPVVLGIPDLRVYEDPLIPLADDYRKAEKLQAEAERRTFAELVEYYWTLPTFPPTPADLSARFVHHVLTDDERIRGYEDLLGHGRRFLDVGCGAGVLVRVAARRFPVAVGCDVGFRWLIVARKGLEEAGEPVRLVCCCADALPFAPGTFDSVASVALLEHMIDASAATREMCRVTRPGGRTFLWTTNRFSLAPEPHVGVWGVGFLPRKWMPAYVRWRRGMAYEKKHSLSRPELGRILRAAGFREATFFLPAITGPDLVGRAWWERLAARIYRVARRVPVLSGLLAYVAPVLQVVAQAPHPSRAPKVG